jgi:fused signal recognition particle receptor
VEFRWRPWKRKGQDDAPDDAVVAPPEAEPVVEPVVEPQAPPPPVVEAEPAPAPPPAPEPEPEPAPEPAPAPAPALEPAPPPSAVEEPEAPHGRFARLRSRLKGGLGANVAAIFGRGAITEETWEQLEETLLLADVGVAATDEILDRMRARLKRQADADPREALTEALLAIINPDLERGISLGESSPAPIIVVGVNGVGKTTTVGKIARMLVADGFSVVLGAADTYRAAAADQLETWGARVGVPVVRSERDGADPASVAFEAAQRAQETGARVVLIDTAGRLQNKQGLMDELGKIVRVASKVAEPTEILLVVDATTGQNGLAQARVFQEVVGLTGIILTKLDGTAKGGIVLAVQRELGVPVKFVGLGEGADDLAPFDPHAFVAGLIGE